MEKCPKAGCRGGLLWKTDADSKIVRACSRCGLVVGGPPAPVLDEPDAPLAKVKAELRNVRKRLGEKD